MTRTFDRWVEIETASDYTLKRELEMTLEYLARDLKVCGPGYPSPRHQTIVDIILEQEKRKVRAEFDTTTTRIAPDRWDRLFR